MYKYKRRKKEKLTVQLKGKLNAGFHRMKHSWPFFSVETQTSDGGENEGIRKGLINTS